MKKVYVLGICLVTSAMVALATIGHAQHPSQPAQDSELPLNSPAQFAQPPAAQTNPAEDQPQPVDAEFQPLGGSADPSPLSDNSSAPHSLFPTQAVRPDIALEAEPRGEMGVWLVASGPVGVEIRHVTEGGAAALAGLQPGDVLLQVNGQGATSPHAVSQLIRSMPPGQEISLNVWRDGNVQEFTLALQQLRERPQAPAPDLADQGLGGVVQASGREPYESSFRGEAAMGSSGSDIVARTTRLEDQHAMVMKELERMRLEISQLRSGGATQAASEASGLSEPATGVDTATDAGFSALDQPPATQPEPIQPQAPATEPAALEAIATEPASADTDPIEGATTDESSELDADSDPFADTTEPASEPTVEEPTATETEPPAEESSVSEAPPESEPETDAEADALFE
jgi:hypothetical protein